MANVLARNLEIFGVVLSEYLKNFRITMIASYNNSQSA